MRKLLVLLLALTSACNAMGPNSKNTCRFKQLLEVSKLLLAQEIKQAESCLQHAEQDKNIEDISHYKHKKSVLKKNQALVTEKLSKLIQPLVTN